ncbi:hypothetical protein AAZX31_18G117900 [Glycine max]
MKVVFINRYIDWMADSSTQMVEVAPEMTYRIHKLLSFKLSVSSEVTLEHDAGEVINHFSSNLFSSAFSERCNIAFDTSLATGEPFWNICIRLFENSVIT